jgi:hypothetical protein
MGVNLSELWTGDLEIRQLRLLLIVAGPDTLAASPEMAIG